MLFKQTIHEIRSSNRSFEIRNDS